MISTIVLYYLFFSILVGVIYTGARVWRSRKELFHKETFIALATKARDNVLDEKAKRGHVQKEVYTGREKPVYYEKDLYGRLAIKSNQRHAKVSKKYTKTYILIIVLVGVIRATIYWPKIFYDWANKEKKK